MHRDLRASQFLILEFPKLCNVRGLRIKPFIRRKFEVTVTIAAGQTAGCTCLQIIGANLCRSSIKYVVPVLCLCRQTWSNVIDDKWRYGWRENHGKNAPRPVCLTSFSFRQKNTTTVQNTGGLSSRSRGVFGENPHTVGCYVLDFLLTFGCLIQLLCSFQPLVEFIW